MLWHSSAHHHRHKGISQLFIHFLSADDHATFYKQANLLNQLGETAAECSLSLFHSLAAEEAHASSFQNRNVSRPAFSLCNWISHLQIWKEALEEQSSIFLSSQTQLDAPSLAYTPQLLSAEGLRQDKIRAWDWVWTIPITGCQNSIFNLQKEQTHKTYY